MTTPSEQLQELAFRELEMLKRLKRANAVMEKTRSPGIRGLALDCSQHIQEILIEIKEEMDFLLQQQNIA